VASAASKSGVPAELLYSIMRQESSFNPEARSPADAFGLMQLLPSVAEHASARAEVAFEKPEDLYRPEINVPLGAAFLRELLDRWGGQIVLAAASYNANERAIHAWLRTRFHGDPLAFIEEIPYDETRGYVKLVARNFIFYSRLSEPSKESDFPVDVLSVDPARIPVR
jgi:soluble lytic murein transglycosylase